MIPLSHIAQAESINCGQSLAEISPQFITLCGGVVGRGSPTSWVNRAEGLGFSGPVTATDLDHLIKWFDDAELDAVIKTCPYAHPSLFEHLSAAGFKVKHFEQVFFRELSSPVFPDHSLPTDLEIRLVDPRDTEAVRAHAQAVVQGFTPPGKAIREDDVAMTMRCATRPRAFTFGAYNNDFCVGGGGFELAGDLAQLYGVAILEPFRRRGLQQAFIAARLNSALQRGARFATIASSPGEPTERNVRRFGFQVLYTKLVLIRPRGGESGSH